MVVEIGSLRGKNAAVFAAACAERLLPLCKQFAEETTWTGLASAMSALDSVWSRASMLKPTAPAEDVERWVPDGDDYDHSYIVAAQNCCICIAIALEGLADPNVRNATVASEYTLDALVSAELCKREGFYSAGDDERLRSIEESIRDSPMIRKLFP